MNPLLTHPTAAHKRAYAAALHVLRALGITESTLLTARQAAERASQPRKL
jgi:GTP cyclohydrolase II